MVQRDHWEAAKVAQPRTQSLASQMVRPPSLFPQVKCPSISLSAREYRTIPALLLVTIRAHQALTRIIKVANATIDLVDLLAPSQSFTTSPACTAPKYLQPSRTTGSTSRLRYRRSGCSHQYAHVSDYSPTGHPSTPRPHASLHRRPLLHHEPHHRHGYQPQVRFGSGRRRVVRRRFEGGFDTRFRSRQ